MNRILQQHEFRSMPRSRPIREPCDCRDCAEPGPPPLHVQAAIARQEPPPKSLLILLHNVTAFSELSSFTAFPHLTAMVRDGSSGFLTTDTACRSLKDSVESLLKDGSACASSSLQSRSSCEGVVEGEVGGFLTYHGVCSLAPV